MAVAVRVTVSSSVKIYIIDLVDGTRQHPDVLLGASPRSALFLQRLSRLAAALRGREYVTPDDIKMLAHPVLEHLIGLRPEAQMRGETLPDVLEDLMARLRCRAPRPGSPPDADPARLGLSGASLALLVPLVCPR